MTFAEKLLQLRKREGYSQEELANKLDVSRQAISRWEMGTAVPDSSNLLQISKLFSVSTDYLLNDEYASDDDLPKVKEKNKNLRYEKDAKQYKKNVKIELVYCMVQAVIFLFGYYSKIYWAGTLFLITVALIYILWVNPKYMNRRMTK